MKNYLEKLNKKLVQARCRPLNDDNYYWVEAWGKRMDVYHNWETKKHISFEEAYKMFQKRYKKGDVIEISNKIYQDFEDYDYHIRSETEYYGWELSYPEICIYSPKTYKLKLRINQWFYVY